MSETEQILDRFVESQGWSDTTVLDLALTYIDNQGDHAGWEDYLTSLAEVDDDMDDIDTEAITQSKVLVHFRPEVWVNDYAVEATTDWDQDTWFVSNRTAAQIQRAIEADGGVDLDFVRNDRFALKWAREWSGPFTITVVNNEES